MKIFSFKTFLALFVSIVLLSSCSKKGDPGAPGTNGTNGTNGAPGNQVNASGTFQLTDADYDFGYWSVPNPGGGMSGIGAKVATVKIDSITQEIFASGSVLVYMENSSDFSNINQWVILPFTIPAFTTGYSINVEYGVQKGLIKIYYHYTLTDAAATVPNIFSSTVPTLNFRYMIIPSSKGFGTNSSPVDIHNYHETAEYLHLN